MQTKFRRNNLSELALNNSELNTVLGACDVFKPNTANKHEFKVLIHNLRETTTFELS